MHRRERVGVARQRGDDVFFLTGTDEHGEPVALAAEREGVTAQELVDRNAPKFRELAGRIGATNDFFIRTTDPEHMAKVQEVVQRVYDNGHVYEGLYEGWYCPRCADFKTESEIGPDNTCPIHEIPLEREREHNWFFRLSAFEDDLRRLYEERPDFVLPAHRRNEAISFVVECDGQAEVDRLWDALTADGGEPGPCGWLKDRFGLSWQIAPRELNELMDDPDPDRARRAMESMLQMGKIDLEEIRRAADAA